MKIAAALTGGFLELKLAAAVGTGSLALLSDTAHILTDFISLVIALIATRTLRDGFDVHHSAPQVEVSDCPDSAGSPWARWESPNCTDASHRMETA